MSPTAARAALRRLKHKGLIAAPVRGFHVIVPPEYQALGCLPPEQFIPQLMDSLGVPYYAGLLTAARVHGAAHHQPQVFQVVVPKNRPSIRCGRAVVTFAARHNAVAIPALQLNTPRGHLRVSIPEATAFDLVGYPRHCGGLSNVATVLAELAEKLNPERLAAVAPLSPIPWAQRLGYLLELVGEPERAPDLAEYVARTAMETAALSTMHSRGRSRRDSRWKLVVNVEVEPDL